MAAPRVPRTRRRSPATEGFLLTETLATFVISAFVLLGLVSAASVLLRAVDRSVERVQNVDDLGRTMDAVDRDVSGLARARWNGYEPQSFVFHGGPNSLFFALDRRGADGSSDMRVVALREIVAGGGTRLVRAEAKLTALATSFEDLSFGPPRELGTGSARLRFFYVMPGRENVRRPASRDWSNDALLPAAIIVEAVDRVSGRRLVSTRVPIHTNADIGCLAQGDGGGQGPPIAGTGVPAPGSATAPLGTPAGGVASAPDVAPSAPGAADPGVFCGRLDEDKDQAKQGTVAASPGQATQATPGPQL